MRDGLAGSAKLLRYKKGTISRSAMLPPGPPGKLQNQEHKSAMVIAAA